MKKLTLLLIACICVVYSVHAQDTKMDTIVARSASDFAKGQTWMGFSAGVFYQGKTHLYNYGVAEKDKGQTLYEIGSISKTFTSILLAHAVLEKKVKLDDDIRKYLRGNYPNLEYQGKPIQLLHLVNLTSGLPNNMPINPGDIKNVSQDSIPFAFIKVLKDYTKEQLLKDLYKVKLDTIPGLNPRHSNAAALVLAYILENIYNKSYAELIKQYITGPLKMENTFVVVPDARMQLIATGHDEKGTVMPLLPGNACMLKSSITDMVKYIQYQLEEKDPAVKMTHENEWGDINSFALGMNWFMGKTGDGKLKIHDDGTTFGFTTYILLYPELKFGSVLMTNVYSNNSNDQLGQLSDRIFNENYYTPAQLASDGFGFSASINTLLTELNKRGFDQAPQAEGELQKNDPQFKLSENEVNSWAYFLFRKGKKQQALEIFKLNVALYPQGYNTYDSLAETYEGMGNKELAIKNYRRSLELNPQNKNAIEHLKHLE